MEPNDVRRQLEHYRAFDIVEEAHLAKTIAFVDAYPDNFWRRTTLAGHMTASAFVVNKEHSHALMLKHAALQKWLQPGGHIDDSDASPLAAAMRETIEETGIAASPRATSAIVALAKPNERTDVGASKLYDVDVHAIPARIKNGVEEPAHHHYDLRYLLVAASADVKLSMESSGFRWVEIAALADGRVESGIARMARKLMNG